MQQETVLMNSKCAHCGVELGHVGYILECFWFDGKQCCSACYHQLNGPRKMQALIDSFPSLKRRGMKWSGPYSADSCLYFKKQMKAMSHGEKCAAKFVLMVYNHYDNKFDFNDAMGVLDQESVEVIRQWMANRWWM